jgi:hypothetical protein
MKIEVIIPNDLSEITLDQYQRFLKIQENNTDEKFLTSKMIEIFCGIKLPEVLKMRVNDVALITNILTEMFENIPQLVQRFKMNGVEYGFIPDLDDMSLGEYIDLDTYLGDWENIHRAMAVLYRPIKNKSGNRYNIKDYDGKGFEDMKDMPLDAVLSSIVFFYNLGIELSKSMMNYLETTEEEALTEYLNSQQNGVGINQFTHSLTEILQDLKISLN